MRRDAVIVFLSDLLFSLFQPSPPWAASRTRRGWRKLCQGYFQTPPAQRRQEALVAAREAERKKPVTRGDGLVEGATRAQMGAKAVSDPLTNYNEYSLVRPSFGAPGSPRTMQTRRAVVFPHSVAPLSGTHSVFCRHLASFRHGNLGGETTPLASAPAFRRKIHARCGIIVERLHIEEYSETAIGCAAIRAVIYIAITTSIEVCTWISWRG